MKVAFCLFRYFPYGGLQRDLFAAVARCLAAGHRVRVFASAWEGDRPEGCELSLLPVRGHANHTRVRRFAAALGEALGDFAPDAVVGFDKLPGLDLYFAAEPCYLDRAHGERGRLYRMMPRFRTYAALEESVFGEDAQTRILLIDPHQEAIYRRWYGTPVERFAHLPPGVARDRAADENAPALRRAGRAELGVEDPVRLLLLLGSDFRRKGLDRAIRALAALPEPLRRDTRLLAVGQDADRRMPKLARRLGVADALTILPGRDDVPRLLQAADLLIHPARSENTGTVLLEAVVAGLPVLTTAACGYAHYIDASGAGRVVREPFRQKELDQSLQRMLEAGRDGYRRRALAWAAGQDLHGQHDRLLIEIESLSELA